MTLEEAMRTRHTVRRYTEEKIRQDEVVADPLGQKELQGGAEGLRILRHQAHGQAAAFVAAPHPLVPGWEYSH